MLSDEKEMGRLGSKMRGLRNTSMMEGQVVIEAYQDGLGVDGVDGLIWG